MPIKVEISQEFRKSRAELFAELADHDNLGRILGVPMKRLVDGSGPGGKNGVGSVRLVGPAPVGFEETVVHVVPDELIEYRVTRGGPIKNHLGRMEFRDSPKGSTVAWTITFDPKVPGTGPLLEAVLGGSTRKALARHAKR